MTSRAGELNGVFYQYFMPNVVLQATAIFWAFRSINNRNQPVPAWMRMVAGLSFGVYLCHEVFLRLMRPVLAPLPDLVELPLLVLVVLVLSLAASWLFFHIPYVRFLTLGESPLRSSEKG